MRIIDVLFSFDGRLRRSTFWLAYIGASLAVAVVGFVVLVLFSGWSAVDWDAGAGFYDLSPFSWLAFFPVWAAGTWIGLALGVKRCHDRGYPGAMILITLVPFFGSLWALIDLGFIDGAPGPNRYGPSPKGYVAASH